MTAATTPAARVRWLKKLARETAREKLRRARHQVREARAAKKSARARARRVCARARTKFGRWVKRERARLKQQIAQLRAQLKTQSTRYRTRLQKCCGKEQRARVRQEADASIGKARAQLLALDEERKLEKLWSGAGSLIGGPLKAKDKKAESDGQVMKNLSEDELVIWRRVKGKIKASDRMSRTEAFQQWVHDHSSEVAEIFADEAEAQYRQAVRDEQQERKRAAGSRSHRALAAYVGEALEEVPF